MISGFAWRDLSQLELLAHHGQLVNGTVQDLSMSRGKSTSYFVEYTYSAYGRELADRQSVSQELYDSLHYGSSVAVTFDPMEPEVHRFGQVDAARIGGAKWKWFGLIAVFSCLVGAIMLACEIQANRERIALRGFQAVPAQVVKLDPESKTSRGTTATVSYGVDETADIRLSQHYPGIEVGSALTMLLHPSNRNHSVLLPSVTLMEVVPPPE